MIVVASSNGRVGMAAAMAVLADGGGAVDAVEAGIRQVEANPEDHTVGYSGYPNILGQVELDASLMNGRTLESGAVGALRGYPHPISVARGVMEQLPHVLLVGEGAARFAAEMGFEAMDLLTTEAREVWEERLRRDMPAAVRERLDDDAELSRWVALATDPERAGGTVNFIAQDAGGDIASGVSTSGWAWKYPGRLGDSPLIGAGNYADNRFGAATCTGMGEMAIRAATAHSAVLYMKSGMSPEEAGVEAMGDLAALGGPYVSMMHLLVLDRNGRHAGFSTTSQKTYVYQTDEMTAPAEAARTQIPIEARWSE